MASLKDAQQLGEELRSRVDDLHKELTDGEVDFSAIVRLADEVGEMADRVAVTFQKVNNAFEQQGEEGESEASGGQSLTDALAPGSRGQQRSSRSDDSMSREDLYERAKEADIPGRSEMSKDELARALKKAGAKVS
jgi:Rho termination factor, N-terminal domain